MVWLNTEKVHSGWNHEIQCAYHHFTKTTIFSKPKVLLLPKPDGTQGANPRLFEYGELHSLEQILPVNIIEAAITTRLILSIHSRIIKATELNYIGIPY